MQANGVCRNDYRALEGLAKLCEADPFQCAIICGNIDEMEGGCFSRLRSVGTDRTRLKLSTSDLLTCSSDLLTCSSDICSCAHLLV